MNQSDLYIVLAARGVYCHLWAFEPDNGQFALRHVHPNNAGVRGVPVLQDGNRERSAIVVCECLPAVSTSCNIAWNMKRDFYLDVYTILNQIWLTIWMKSILNQLKQQQNDECLPSFVSIFPQSALVATARETFLNQLKQQQSDDLATVRISWNNKREKERNLT